jgi:hypothetical protein
MARFAAVCCKSANFRPFRLTRRGIEKEDRLGLAIVEHVPVRTDSDSQQFFGLHHPIGQEGEHSKGYLPRHVMPADCQPARWCVDRVVGRQPFQGFLKHRLKQRMQACDELHIGGRIGCGNRAA